MYEKNGEANERRYLCSDRDLGSRGVEGNLGLDIGRLEGGDLGSLAVRDEVTEHLDGVERSTGALGVELDTPNGLARIVSRLDALN